MIGMTINIRRNGKEYSHSSFTKLLCAIWANAIGERHKEHGRIEILQIGNEIVPQTVQPSEEKYSWNRAAATLCMQHCLRTYIYGQFAWRCGDVETKTGMQCVLSAKHVPCAHKPHNTHTSKCTATESRSRSADTRHSTKWNECVTAKRCTDTTVRRCTEQFTEQGNRKKLPKNDEFFSVDDLELLFIIGETLIRRNSQ